MKTARAELRYTIKCKARRLNAHFFRKHPELHARKNRQCEDLHQTITARNETCCCTMAYYKHVYRVIVRYGDGVKCNSLLLLGTLCAYRRQRRKARRSDVVQLGKRLAYDQLLFEHALHVGCHLRSWLMKGVRHRWAGRRRIGCGVRHLCRWILKATRHGLSSIKTGRV
jgi:hypothetical protein